MNVLAVDPGGTTGLATQRDGKWRAWMAPFEETGEAVQAELARGGWDLCVFENFIITAATLKKGRQGSQSLELIGVGRYLCKCYGVPFETQNPSDAMSFSTDKKLKALGWWTKGPDHANAASRHLLLALARHKTLAAEQLEALVRSVT